MFLRGASTILLLVCSNIFMTLAWYGHIAFKSRLEKWSLAAIVVLSWGVALFEYCFQVPANRLGSAELGGPFTIWQLKVIQEVVSLVVFTLFVVLFMKATRLNGIIWPDSHVSFWPYTSYSESRAERLTESPAVR